MNKKQKWLIGIAISIVGLWIAYNQWQLNIQTSQASVDYWFEKTTIFWTGDNSVLIHCRNGGEMDGDFNLVLQFTNATFSNQTEKPYYQVNQTTVKCRFLLHKGESNNKSIHFSINDTMKDFSLFLALEKIDQNPLKANPMYPTYLRYAWNEQEKCFESIE